MQTADIAARQAIPEPYLDQLLTQLNKFGYIRSRRGPQGGHMLAMDPSNITLSVVMTTLEGNKPPRECIHEPNECTLGAQCAQREVWRTVEEAIQNVLSGITIADLAKRQLVLAAPASKVH